MCCVTEHLISLQKISAEISICATQYPLPSENSAFNIHISIVFVGLETTEELKMFSSLPLIMLPVFFFFILLLKPFQLLI